MKISDYLTDEEKPKTNIKIEEKIDKKESIENNNQIDKLNGIIEIKYGNEIYRIWKVEFIRPYIFKFLKEKYIDSIIIPEINLIDDTIFDNKSDNIIPVEIQKTPITAHRFAHAQFENLIRKQLEDNIENYDKCWLFMDSEYLRFLQSGNIGKQTSVCMTWLVKLMRENTLKVFTVKYNGEVKELTTKDFDFLKNISQTCVISHNSDKRTLNRNKLKIFRDVIRGYKFDQDEINNFYEEYKKSNDNRMSNFFMKNKNDRCKLYGNILHAIGNLKNVNNCLDMNITNRIDKYYLIWLGIIDNIGVNNYNSNVKFVDKFNICQYFPGYLRKEKHWLTYKGREIVGNTFSLICSGLYKNAPTLEDY